MRKIVGKILNALGKHKYMVKISIGNPFNKLIQKLNVKKQKQLYTDDMGNNDYQRNGRAE